MCFVLCMVTDSLATWRGDGKIAVWLHIPISLCRLASAAATHGFTFHHAHNDQAVLCLWMGEGESRLPGFATHQVGVAGKLSCEYRSKSSMKLCVCVCVAVDGLSHFPILPFYSLILCPGDQSLNPSCSMSWPSPLSYDWVGESWQNCLRQDHSPSQEIQLMFLQP